jgi:hypothetical protein
MVLSRPAASFSLPPVYLKSGIFSHAVSKLPSSLLTIPAPMSGIYHVFLNWEWLLSDSGKTVYFARCVLS